MSDNNQLSKQQELFLALREQAKKIIHNSMEKGKLITPEELNNHLSTFAKEHSNTTDIHTWLQQANRDLVHEYMGGKVSGTSELPVDLSSSNTLHNVAQDYIINSVLLQKFPPMNINAVNTSDEEFDSQHHITPEELLATLEKEGLSDVAQKINPDFDPKHHITTEEFLDILEREGLSDTVGKSLFGDNTKGKDFIIGDVHGGLPEHMRNAMRIPDSKYGVNIPEDTPVFSQQELANYAARSEEEIADVYLKNTKSANNTETNMGNITAFHDANEDYIPDSKDEPEYRKKLREFFANSPKFIHTDEESSIPWYLSPEVIASMKGNPFYTGNLANISETPLEYAKRTGKDDIAQYLESYLEQQRNNPGQIDLSLRGIPVLDITNPQPGSLFYGLPPEELEAKQKQYIEEQNRLLGNPLGIRPFITDTSGSMTNTDNNFDSSLIKNSKGGTDLGPALDIAKEAFKNASAVQDGSSHNTENTQRNKSWGNEDSLNEMRLSSGNPLQFEPLSEQAQKRIEEARSNRSYSEKPSIDLGTNVESFKNINAIPEILPLSPLGQSGLSKESVKKNIQETSDKLAGDNNPNKPKNSI